jgi:hypothetical protein
MPTEEDWEDFASVFPELREPQRLTDEELAQMARQYQEDAIAEANALRPEERR